MRSLRALLYLPLLGLAGCAGCGGRPIPTDGNTGAKIENVPAASLNAGGATFVEPVMSVWTAEFKTKTGDKVKINYQGTGSGDGINKMTSQELAFGCSDAPMNKKEVEAAAAKGGEVLHIPLVLGAVVPMYHLAGVDKPLVFTGPVLGDIYLGKIKKWNEKALADLNPGVNLPDLAIAPVFRAKSSGTSFIFTDYLSKTNPEFKAKVGAVKEIPRDVAGVGMDGNGGVAGHVQKTNGAIGYVELTFALDTKASYGVVRNRNGKDVPASLKSITAAAEAGMKEKQTAEPYSLHDLTYNLNDTAGDDVYPIAALSFALVYKKQSGDKGKAVVEFLKWAVSDEGQRLSEARNYAPLPESLRERVGEKLATVTVE
jgi:phosphate transport system substrate-binding protein